MCGTIATRAKEWVLTRPAAQDHKTGRRSHPKQETIIRPGNPGLTPSLRGSRRSVPRRPKGPCVPTGQPPTADLREHYRRLIHDRLWLAEAMCWTVVVPHNGTALTLNQIAARLSGDAPHQLHVAAPFSAIVPFDGDAYPVLVDWCGPATVLFELDYLGSSPAVLQRLSRGARAYSAWWNVNSHNQLSFAAGGELIFAIDGIFPGRPEDYPGISQWPELQAMTDFFVEFEERGDDYDWQAAWLAVIDQTTGARLTCEWFDQAHPYVTVRMSDATR